MDTGDAEELLSKGSKYAGAVQLMLKAAAENQGSNLEVLMMLVKACLLKGGRDVIDAIGYGRHCLMLSQAASPQQQAQAGVLLGLALRKAAASTDTPLHVRKSYSEEAIQILLKAATVLPGSAVVLYNLALALAETRQLLQALACVRKALAAQPEPTIPAWALTALILSAQRHHVLALSVIEAGFRESSKMQQSLLLRIRARIQLIQGDKAAALRSLAMVKGLLQQEENTSSDPEGNGSLLWLELADTFVVLSQPEDVAHCIEKARQGSGSTAQSFHLQAQLHQLQGETDGAVRCCQSALAIDPTCAGAASTLGQLLYLRGKHHDLTLARGLLLDAVQLDATHVSAWQYLGLVNRAQGQVEAAADCLKTSLVLKQSQPVLPFHMLSIAL